MSEKIVEATFDALFALTDLRQILRETKPDYKLDSEQKTAVQKILGKVRESAEIIEEGLLK